MSNNSILDAALAYARRGWFIYPSMVKNGPALVKWATASTTDAATIRRWWTHWPKALICLDCGKSGLAAIDLDVKAAKDGTPRNGPQVLSDLELIFGRVPKTLTQRTPSGGLHLVFTGTIKTTASIIGNRLPFVFGEGVDSRGHRGMIVLAPSAGYRMKDPSRPIADLPPWLAELAGAIYERPESGDGDFDPLYTDEEFAALLNLIPVERYDDNHDAWLELMLACSHASTVANGKAAFMEWTLRDGPGNRIGYGSDEALIDARWEHNAAKCNMIGGVMVGTFNRHVSAAAPGATLKSPITAADDFANDVEERVNWKAVRQASAQRQRASDFTTLGGKRVHVVRPSPRRRG